MKLTTLKSRLSTLPTKQRMQVLAVDRLRGRAAVNRRTRWLQAHPLCVDCEREGRVTAGQVVDHIVPLWKGGSDDYEANGQTLCITHHDAKTAAEAAERARGG